MNDPCQTAVWEHWEHQGRQSKTTFKFPTIFIVDTFDSLRANFCLHCGWIDKPYNNEEGTSQEDTSTQVIRTRVKNSGKKYICIQENISNVLLV
jgi:hypothetical protein